MRHLSALAVAVCLPVLACGGPEPEESPGSTSDSRAQLVGTYDATGTLTEIINGVPRSTPRSDTLELQSGATRDVITVRLASLDCTLEGKMNGQRAFTFHGKACALPPNDDCTSTMNFTGGSGDWRHEGLKVSLQAQRHTRCGGGQPVVAAITLELSGPQR